MVINVGLPDPPENVQLVLRDGLSVPVDCRWVGYDDEGMACWEVITAWPAYMVERVTIARMPGRTTISLPMPDGPW